MRSSSLHIPGPPAHQQVNTDITALKQSIIKTIVYFDIFHYPLSAAEILKFLDSRTSENLLHEALGQLLKEKRLFIQSGFFSIQNNPLLAIRRQAGNERAQVLLKKARKIGRFLFYFPFVRAVAISGSLSKNYADQKADIDFFIITKANRLWVARTIMHLYKKLTFLTGRQHYYCMNYYIDETSLKVKEQNIFNAIEIKTLVPVCGKTGLDQFFETNEWTDNWLPLHGKRLLVEEEPNRLWLKNICEWMLSGRVGIFIEKYFFKVTRKRWEQKHRNGKLNCKGLPMDLVIEKHFSYSNPGSFKEKVLSVYMEKLRAEEMKNFTVCAVD